MTIFESNEVLAWGELDVPLLGLTHDWHGTPMQPPAGYALVADPHRLWFIASHSRPALLHPQARPGKFQAELWRYDVAELFLATPSGIRYFEFNLAPNGAWWSCEFKGPRQREEETDIAMPEVATFAELAPDGSWLAAMALPLDLLRARLDFGAQTRANVAFLLGSPAQRLLSAIPLGEGEPDFHRPARFGNLRPVPLPTWENGAP